MNMGGKEEGCGCKIEEVTQSREVTGVNEYLISEWKAGIGVRKLTEELNKDLIESELKDANISQVRWSRLPVYEGLKTNSLSEAEQITIRRELDRAGVDVEQLASDLVSHQTVYRHLTGCLGVTKTDTRTPSQRRENAMDTVFALQRRTELVTGSTIDSLRSAGIADLGEIDVFVNIQVVCRNCNCLMDFESSIGEGCDCTH